MKQSLIAVCCGLVALSMAGAVTLDEVDGWLGGPGRFLVTDAERSALAELGTDAEVEEFFELFWARRDPDLGTSENEFRFDFEARVEAADAEFGEKSARGALTPRGQVLILLGVPSRHAKMEIADYMSRLYDTPPPPVVSSDPNAQATMHGVSFNRARGEADLWAYSREALPAGIELEKGESEVVFAFFDTLGTGAFVLQGGIRGAREAQTVLEQAPAALLLHPDLDHPPAPALTVGGRAAAPEQLAVFDAAELPWPEGSQAMAARGARSGDELPAWVLFVLPRDVPVAEVAVVRVLLADGKVHGSMQRQVSGRQVEDALVYELDVPLPAAECRLELALFAGDAALAARRFELDPSAAGEAFMSQVFAGRQVEQATDSAAGDPFVFGGYHLLPEPRNRYRSGDNLNLFFLIARGGDEVTEIAASVRMRWYVDGTSTPSAAPSPVVLRPAGPGVYVWGTQIPLSSLQGGKEYALKVKVTTDDGSLERTTVIPIVMNEQ